MILITLFIVSIFRVTESIEEIGDFLYQLGEK